jgi:hypothetical protein
MTFENWLIELDKITNAEFGLSVADLPDAPTLDAYNEELSPDDAFEIFVVDYWHDYNPEAPAEMLDIFHYELNDSPDIDAGGQCYSDADPGL